MILLFFVESMPEAGLGLGWPVGLGLAWLVWAGAWLACWAGPGLAGLKGWMEASLARFEALIRMLDCSMLAWLA